MPCTRGAPLQVSAWALHGATGAWGVFFVGLMADPGYMEQVYGPYGLGADLKDGKRYVLPRPLRGASRKRYSSRVWAGRGLQSVVKSTEQLQQWG